MELQFVTFSAIGNRAIARAAMWGVRGADAGYKVTAVTHLLEESLQGEVEWLRTEAPAGYSFPIRPARHWVKAVLKRRSFDILHAQQAQIVRWRTPCSAILTRRLMNAELRTAARRADGRPTPAAGIHRKTGIPESEPRDQMLFDSAMLQQEFIRLYGKPKHSDVLVLAAPEIEHR